MIRLAPSRRPNFDQPVWTNAPELLCENRNVVANGAHRTHVRASLYLVQAISHSFPCSVTLPGVLAVGRRVLV